MKITKIEEGKFLIEFDDSDIYFPNEKELRVSIETQVFRPKEKYLQILEDSINRRGGAIPEGSLTPSFLRNFLQNKSG